MKNYRVSVEFKGVEIRVRAATARLAKKAAREKLKRRPAAGLIDTRNTTVESE